MNWRDQVQRDDITGIGAVRVEGLLDSITRLQLRLSCGETRLDRVAIKLHAISGQARLLQSKLNSNHGVVIHPYGRFAR